MEINKYQVEEIGDKIYKIDEFDLTTMFLIEGSEQSLAIDCGTGVADYMNVIRHLTKKPVILAATHGHVDHIGGRGQFRTLRISRSDSKLIKRCNTVDRGFFVFKMKLLKRCSIPFKDVRIEKVPEEPMTMFIRQDDIIDLGNRHIEVFETPGHTDGSLSFLLKENKILFTGDVVNPLNLMFFRESDSVDMLKDTIERIKKIDGWDNIWTSHAHKPLPKEMLDAGLKCADNVCKNNNSLIPFISKKTVNGFSIYYRTDKIHKEINA